MLQALLANVASVVVALLAWNALGHHAMRSGRAGSNLLFGAAMGGGVLGSMALAYEFSPGTFYDMRGPLLALSGFFGGWPVALAVGAAAAAYRATMGGAVALGFVVIVCAAATGLAARALVGRRRRGSIHLAALGAAVAFQVVPLMALMPAAARTALLGQLWITGSLTFVGTFLLGSLLLQQERQRELWRINRLYRSMVDSLPDCLNMKDPEGRFLAANPATARLMRAVSPEALVGKTDFDFYPAELAADFLADERRIMAGGIHQTIEQRGRMSDGSSGWLSTLKNPIFDEDGTLAGLVTHNRDITEAKGLREKLERTQTFLDDALENMNDGLAMFSPEGTLLFCNRRYRELFHVTGHLRVSGARFEDILRASVAMGEVGPPAGMCVDAYVADRLAGLGDTAERTLDTKDGRTLSGRTRVLANGSSLVMMADITEQRNFERHLRYRALHDPLTGLPNRACFNETFAALLKHAREADEELMVMLLDLDHFKQVNDTHGHAAGDTLLKEVSRRLEGAVRLGDHVARLGGDEFALLLPRGKGLFNDAAQVAHLVKKLAAPMEAGEAVLTPSATIGYTLASRDAADAEGLLKNADRALYQAKSRRRGTWRLWSPGAEVEPAALAG